MTTPAILFAAKSTEDKHGSIPTQLEQGRERADREGWERRPEWEFQDEDRSAYHGNRGDGLAEAMAMCEQLAPCVLIVQHSDRLARGDVKEARHLVEYAIWAIKHDIRLVSLQDPEMLPEGEHALLMSVIGGMRNHQDSKRKAQSVRDGIQRQRAKGKPWGPPGLGWAVEKRITEGGDVSIMRVIDSKEHEIVQVLFHGLDKGFSTGAVARLLNANYRTRRGHDFKARTVRAIAENSDYTGTAALPRLIEPELWQRVNENIKRPDRAAVQNEKGGRAPKADFMLRKLCFCGECGRAMYAVTRHGKRIYVCCAQLQRRGTCSSLKVPAELADERILEHLTTFVGSVEEWIGERLAERSDEQVVLERSLERARTKLDELTDLREQRMAELIEVGITTIGMEAIQRIDRQVEAQEKKIADGEAQLAEWTAQLSADGILDFYNRIVDLVKGRIARANGIAEINVVLHDSLTGVWLSYDGKTLTADVTFRETGDDYWDECLMEMFGNLEARPEAIDEQREALAGQLPNTPPRRW